jgi:hypothetical protein
MAEGMVSPKCGAKRTTSEARCQMPAGYGTQHPGVGPCKHHFGATPVIERKYMLHNLRHTSIEIMESLGSEVDGDITPERVMREELRRSYILVHVLESQMDINGLMWPDMNKMLLDERKHAVDVAAKMIGLGIAEREVRVMEAQAVIFGQGVRAILDALDLTEDQWRQAPAIVGRVMAELDAAA